MVQERATQPESPVAQLMNVQPSQIQRVDTSLFATEDPQPVPDTTLIDQVGSAWLLDSPEFALGGIAGKAAAVAGHDIPDYDVWDDLTEDEKLHADDYAHVDSPYELSMVRQWRTAEQAWREQLGDGPLNPLVASALAILGMPSTYLSGFTTGGITLAGRAARVGAVVAAETAATEGVLQLAQEDRSIQESAAAIAMGGAFGFGIGAVGARLADGAVRSAADDMAALLKAADEEAAGGPQPGGAAVSRNYSPEDSKLASSFGVAEAEAKGTFRFMQAPSLTLMNSVSHTAREAVQRLAYTGMLTKGVLKGYAADQAVDIAIGSRRDQLNFAVSRGMRAAYRERKKSGGRLSRNDFYEAVGKAARRDSGDPIIDRAAREFRDAVLDPLSKEAKKWVPGFKMLPDVDGWRYVSRVVRKDKIAADRANWEGVVAKHFLDTKQAIDMADAEEMAAGVTDSYLGLNAGRTDLILAPASLRGPTKERVFDIPDRLIEPWLENNIMALSGRYINTLVSDIEFARAFQDHGNPMDPMKDWTAKIRDEVKAEAEKAAPHKREAILEAGEADIKLLAQLTNRVRGTDVTQVPGVYGKPIGVLLKVGRDVSATRSLGSVLGSSLPDPGRIVMQEGLYRTMGPLFQGLTDGFKAIRLGLKQAQQLGAATDIMLADTSMARYDLEATHVGNTALEKTSRVSGRLTTRFMQSTGLQHWNTFWKGVASVVGSTRLLRAAERLAAGKTLSRFDRIRMAQSGLSDADMLAIAKESAHWQQVGVSRLANVNEWGNKEAARKFRNAMYADINDAVITPSHADAPLWTGSDLGKTVFQFKRFGMAANQRILIAGLQRRDGRVLSGVVSMVALGYTADMIKDVINHGEVRDLSVRQRIGNGIDRSGILSLYTELEALAPMNLRPTTYAFDRPLSRFANRGMVSQAAGPTAGWFEDAAKAASGIAEGIKPGSAITSGDVHHGRRLIPFQNHILISAWLTQLEQSLGLPQKRP